MSAGKRFRNGADESRTARSASAGSLASEDGARARWPATREEDPAKIDNPEAIDRIRARIVADEARTAGARGRKHTPETIEKIRAAKLGVRPTAQALANIRAAMNTPEARARNRAARLGARHAPATIEKIRATMLGKNAAPRRADAVLRRRSRGPAMNEVSPACSRDRRRESAAGRTVPPPDGLAGEDRGNATD